MQLTKEQESALAFIRMEFANGSYSRNSSTIKALLDIVKTLQTSEAIEEKPYSCYIALDWQPNGFISYEAFKDFPSKEEAYSFAEEMLQQIYPGEWRHNAHQYVHSVSRGGDNVLAMIRRG